MKYFALLLILLLFAVPASAVSETETGTAVLTRAGFSEQQILRFRAMLENAAQKEIASTQLTSKLHEGIAKKVPPEKILAAMERLTARYELGYALAAQLGQNKEQTTRFGDALASSMAAGLSPDDAQLLVAELTRQMQTKKQDSFVALVEETLLTVQDLSRRGASSGAAMDVMGKALQKGFGPSDMRTMRDAFGAHAGINSAEATARSFGKAIESGKGAHDLSQGSGEGRGGDSGQGQGHGEGQGGGGGAGGGGNGGGHR